jgi:hypothetical protein
VLGEWVVDLAVSGNLVVIRTPPGSAHVVASALDRTPLDGMLGTVAGDDTILAIADEAIGGTWSRRTHRSTRFTLNQPICRSEAPERRKTAKWQNASSSRIRADWTPRWQSMAACVERGYDVIAVACDVGQGVDGVS